MRGRKPKPTELHKQHGTVNVTRHRARLEAEPVPTAALGAPPPEWMSESQKETWRYVMENAAPGVLKTCDADTVRIYVESSDRHKNAMIALAKADEGSEHPMLIMSKNGTLYQSPYVGIINRTALLLIKAANELGLTPASRPRLAGAAGMMMDAPALGAPVPLKANLDSYLANRPADIN